MPLSCETPFVLCAATATPPQLSLLSSPINARILHIPLPKLLRAWTIQNCERKERKKVTWNSASQYVPFVESLKLWTVVLMVRLNCEVSRVTNTLPTSTLGVYLSSSSSSSSTSSSSVMAWRIKRELKKIQNSKRKKNLLYWNWIQISKK